MHKTNYKCTGSNYRPWHSIFFQHRGQCHASLEVQKLQCKQDKSIYCLLLPKDFYPEGRIRKGEAEVTIITIHSLQSDSAKTCIGKFHVSIIYHITIKPQRELTFAQFHLILREENTDSLNQPLFQEFTCLSFSLVTALA